MRRAHCGLKGLLIGIMVMTSSGCSDAIADAETKYEIVKKSGDKREICERSKKLVELYLANNMEEEYLKQKAASEEECTFTTEELLGI